MPIHGRWKFLDETNPEERALRERTLQLIDQWWTEFALRAGELEALFTKETNWDLPAWMDEHLRAIDPNLMWEYAHALRGAGRRLVITPETQVHLRPLVDTILQRAPQLPGWEFYPYRVPEDMDMAIRTVQARTGGNIDGVVVRVEPGERNLVDLTFLSPRVSSSDDDQAHGDAFVASETLLGERCLERWVGKLAVAPFEAGASPWAWFRKTKPPSDTVKLDELKESVEALIREWQAGLPAEPYWRWAAHATWSLLKLKPEDQSDYAGQEDIYVATTASLPLWKATHALSFFDERFSRHGETFAYVKIDGSQGLSGGFSDKREIEDAILEVIEPAGLGTQVGGGTGRRYSYIDLALTDVDAALPAICGRLRQGRVPLRSWIQFFGSDLEREWVGVYPDSPPPPMPGDE